MATFSTFSPIHIEVDEGHGGNPGAPPLQLRGRVIRHGAMGVGIEWEEFGSRMLGELVRIAISPRHSRLLERRMCRGALECGHP